MRLSRCCVGMLYVLAGVSVQCTSEWAERDLEETVPNYRDTPTGAYAAWSSERVGPYLQSVDACSATVLWETDTEGDTWLEYGDTAQYGHVAPAGRDSGLHEVRLSDLDAGRNYHYRVVHGSAATQDTTFRTASPRDTTIRFAVYGDSQTNPEVHRTVSDAILAEAPAFVLHVGDETGDGGDHESWLTEFFRPARRLMAQVPIYVAIGNHEDHASWFYHYHSYPAPQDYYDFEWGNSLVVVLDSTQDLGEGSSQLVWLRTLLQSERARAAWWVWVTFHEPAYAEGWRPCDYEGDLDVRAHLIPILEEYDIDAAFHGHVHGYERGTMHGIQYVTTGGGAGNLDEHCMDWEHISVAEYVHHYVTVDVEGEKAIIRAKRIDGSLIDEVTLRRKVRSRSQEVGVANNRRDPRLN